MVRLYTELLGYQAKNCSNRYILFKELAYTLKATIHKSAAIIHIVHVYNHTHALHNDLSLILAKVNMIGMYHSMTLKLTMISQACMVDH